MGTCNDPQVNCDTCFEVLIGDCLDDITLSLGLTPSTLFFFRLIDKFGINNDFIATTDGSGDFTIPKSQLLTNLINQFAGNFILEIYSNSGRTDLVNVIQNSIIYNCVLLTQTLSGSNNLTPPDVFSDDFSFVYDGVDEYTSLGSDSSLRPDRLDAFSYSVWLKRLTTGATHRIFGNRNHTNTRGWAFNVNNSNQPTFELANTNANRIDIRFGTLTNTTDWFNYLFTYNGSSNASGVTCYRNGIVITPTVVSDNLTGTTIGTVPATLAVRVSDLSRFFNGNLDEVSFWNEELTASDAFEIGNNTPINLSNHSTESSLVSWWRMGEKSSFDGVNFTLFDQKGSSNGTSVNQEFADKITDTPP